MNKNYMPEIARMLGVEIGEPFDVLDEDGEAKDYSPYKFTNETMVDCAGDETSGWLLFCLLAGKYTLQKRPWRPEEDGQYWVIYPDGFIRSYNFSKSSLSDLAFLNMGNCFPSEEAAKTAVPEMLAKFEEIKKGVRL